MGARGEGGCQIQSVINERLKKLWPLTGLN